MTDEPKLLPCPWCGHTNGLVKNPRGDVDCIRCGVGVPHEYWNKRAPDPVRDAMARVCDAADGLDKIITGTIIHLVSVRSVDMAKDVVRHKAAVQNALADLERARKGEG